MTTLQEDVTAKLEKLTANERKLVEALALIAQGFIELRQFASEKLGGIVVCAAVNQKTGEAMDPIEYARQTIVGVVGGKEGFQPWPDNQTTAVN